MKFQRNPKYCIGIMLCLFFYNTLVFAELKKLNPSDDLKNIIETHGKRGDVFYLESGDYLLRDTIYVPSGITIEGDAEQHPILKLNASNTKKIFFSVQDTSDVTLKSLTLKLGAGQIGIHSIGNNQIENISLFDISIIGNLLESLQYQNEQSKYGINIRNINHGFFSNIKIFNTIGGLYAIGDHVNIEFCELKQINLGAIVVHGNDIKISDNIVIESGKGTDFEIGHGDSITIGQDSSNVSIMRNTLYNGYCYIVGAGKVTNLQIYDNLIHSAISPGIMIFTGNNVRINDNKFVSNGSYALAITGGNNVVVDGNVFIDNPVLMSNIINGNIKNNKFEAQPYGTKALHISSNIRHGNNKIEYLSKTARSQILLLTAEKKAIQQGELLELDTRTKNYFAFEILNVGNKTLKLYGRPLVLLADHIESNHGGNKSGASNFADFSIKAVDQPTQRTIAPGERVKFSIRNIGNKLSDNDNIVIVNIPTLDPNYKPFWFKIKKSY